MSCYSSIVLTIQVQHDFLGKSGHHMTITGLARIHLQIKTNRMSGLNTISTYIYRTKCNIYHYRHVRGVIKCFFFRLKIRKKEIREKVG